MTLNDAIKHFGSIWKICMCLNLRGQNGTYWRKIGRIPIMQQFRIEQMTNGKLKADTENVKPKNRKD